MAVTYSTAAKNARLDAVRVLIDAGAGPGVLQIGTAGMAAVLAEFTLVDPSAPSAASGILTFDFDPDISDTVANNTGVAAAARIRDSDGTDVITGLTVGEAASDIILDNTDINAGQTVTITAGTITHA